MHVPAKNPKDCKYQNDHLLNEIIDKLITQITEEPAARPSKPSNQLKAFTIPTIHKMVIN